MRNDQGMLVTRMMSKNQPLPFKRWTLEIKDQSDFKINSCVFVSIRGSPFVFVQPDSQSRTRQFFFGILEGFPVDQGPNLA